MLISTVQLDTPYYVLMSEKQRIGPTATRLNSDVACNPIYGFSTKEAYDRFCTKSEQPLTPYPLVTFYLREQIELPGGGLNLVVVDAVGPAESCLYASTMQSVLDAHDNRLPQVAIDYRLTFDPIANAYQIEESPI